jgi:hypothetical protein
MGNSNTYVSAACDVSKRSALEERHVDANLCYLQVAAEKVQAV